MTGRRSSDTIARLKAASHPAIIIEHWTAISGWPCYKIFALTAKTRTGNGEEYETYAQAHAAAVAWAAGRCPVVDMTD